MPGWNKFILDRIILPVGDKFEIEGPGAALCHDSGYNRATKNISLMLCSDDIEIFTVSFTTIINSKHNTLIRTKS